MKHYRVEVKEYITRSYFVDIHAEDSNAAEEQINAIINATPETQALPWEYDCQDFDYEYDTEELGNGEQ